MRSFDFASGQRAAVWGRALVVVLLCAGLAVVASSDALHSLLLRFLSVAEAAIVSHPVWGATLFVVFAALSAMLAFVSSAVIVPVAVYTWGEAISMLLLWAGWILGGVCAYTLSRYLGRPVVATLLPGDKFVRFAEQISSRTPLSLVLLFQLAVPSEVPGYVLGLAGYPFLKYIFVLSIGELPFVVGTIYLGASFVERRIMLLLAIGAAGAVFSAWAFYTLRKRLLAERAQRAGTP
jgi:uncharacterized membrane protein YdjX (TVP38/TMEM64 family)